ncbi:hypothetical protein CAL22_08705 [Bordetella genomosp. 12]|uniref:Glycine zipper 2TM domain-containing protein n=1 Tax=Bordetella genomosp. 12 TaxID=463035 RepID=A0A261VMB8_9BORD|nr:hypothetical protein CAL22_08705 [Bordetella genomosp. 12]
MRTCLLASTLLALAGCAHNVNPNSYSAGSVGQVNRTVGATIVSVRDVDILGTSGMGATAGGLGGAVAGSAIGGGVRANVLGAVGGAVVGGLIGAAAESSATQQSGVEYVVQTDNGNLMTLVQGASPRFETGAKVLVLYGNPSRVIADPRH